jgi:aspartate 1-decarboxylase
VIGAGGRDWSVAPASGALIKLNGKAARLNTLQVGDSVVVLGQAQSGSHFLAHAITARRK